jgi:hypothetical protein
MQLDRKSAFYIFLLNFNFLWELSDIVQIQRCSNHGTKRSNEVTMRKLLYNRNLYILAGLYNVCLNYSMVNTGREGWLID